RRVQEVAKSSERTLGTDRLAQPLAGDERRLRRRCAESRQRALVALDIDRVGTANDVDLAAADSDGPRAGTWFVAQIQRDVPALRTDVTADVDGLDILQRGLHLLEGIGRAELGDPIVLRAAPARRSDK